MQDKHNCMPTLRRQSNQPYIWTIGEVNLEQVANQERPLPSAFIRSDGFHITPECHNYLTPLIQGESYPTYQQGLPHYWTDSFPIVSKKLPDFSEPL
jgi:hypothetical protein